MAIIFKGNVNNEPSARMPSPPKAKPVDIETLRSTLRPEPSPIPVAPPAPQPAPKVRPQAEKRTPSPAPQQYARSHPRRYYNKDEHLLVVDGKEKKIGKQSRYLLDMLTIED